MAVSTRSPHRGRTFALSVLIVVGGIPTGRYIVQAAPRPVAVPIPEPGLAAEWAHPDGTGGAHYSSLRDITSANVRGLEVAWTYRTGDVSPNADGRAGTAFQSTPLMVDGLLYVSTPYSRVIALDAETGAEVWAFDSGLDRSDRVHMMVTNRGLATWLDEAAPGDAPCRRRIFLASFDARLFALDGETGARCADFGVSGELDLALDVDRATGEQRGHYKQTAPPAVLNGRVIVGSSIFDGRAVEAPSGAVQAFDARTGEQLWSFEPLVGVTGTLSDGRTLTAGAANTWATITPDPEHDLVFVPTGSASPDHWGGLRPGDNTYANSLVALRGSTGEVAWHFQAVHHDLWDYDLPAPPMLLDMEHDGETVPAVALATKMGFLFFFHRLTGEPLFPIEERPVPGSAVAGEVPWPTQPFPTLPEPLHPLGLEPDDAWGLTPWDRAACRDAIASMPSEVFAPPSVEGSIAYPGFVGGMEWGGMAHDADRRILITNTNRMAMVARLIPADQVDEQSGGGGKVSTLGLQTPAPYAAERSPLLSPIMLPCSPPPWGMLHAVDTGTGELLWERPLGTMRDMVRIPTPEAWGSPNLGGAVVTGDLAFIAATMDSRLRAFHVETGEKVWEAELPASGQSTPMTYRVRDGGRQFLVINAGGHAGLKSRLGDYVVAFALPQAPPVADVAPELVP
ncbi:MAG: pyrroloquinoline quinone-dependent dehydrogenase [Gemmatimonadetes bacterium]|nr:pyrroloquinoline quinone-dependent dehydrogenase [Gemmatimonadota bacterium]